MKRVELTKMVQVRDETFTPTKEGERAPTATNYPGAVLTLSPAYADELIARGEAKEYVSPKSDADASPASEASGEEGL